MDDDRFLAQMDQQLTGWADPVARLRAALQKDEFALFCQPIRALSGAPGYPLAEVLVRLREEESALLPPGEFLPVFEHYRMMPQLDRWVVRNTLKRLAAGSKVPRFSVNVSAQSLEDEAFPADCGTELSRSGVAPEALLFEINEPDALGRPEAAARFAAAVKALGFGIMIDGFGHRAASFTPIKTLRPDFLKVDGRIVRRILNHEPASNKLKAISRVAEALGFGVVAECVEEEEILIRAKALGATHAQGFGIYRPHPIDSIAG